MCLKSLCQKIKRTSVNIKGCEGKFAGRNIRLIWLAFGKGDKALIKIHNYADTELAKIGITKDTRYANHVTLVRVKYASDMKKLKSFLDSVSNKDFGCFDVCKLDLMESVLTGDSPVYKIVD